ncbi:MAG: HTH domain-containing protein [Proteobacteria bacterium]|nr:HTH domain-containing protein [Pseudomonadota bacterium]
MNFVTGRRRVYQARGGASYHLSHEVGIPLAEIARHLGVSTSFIIKAIQKLES